MQSNKYKLLFNFGPLKKGGGQNVALNFLQAIEESKNLNFIPYFVACESSLIYSKLLKTKWKDSLVVVSANPVKRMLQEFFQVTYYIRKNKIELVYTYFGFGLFGSKIKQVIGSADSNLYFPEVDFWKHETSLEKLKRFVVDKYRIFGLKIAAGVVFENIAMFERSEKLFGIKTKRLILPSIVGPVDAHPVDIIFNQDSVKILLLCGWQRNKNILLIPELAYTFKLKGLNVQFIITAKQDNTNCSQEFFQLVKKWQVEDFINCIGQVNKSQLPDLYEKVDQVLLLSLLESFSNNIIEAWYFSRPLIIADELWSRAICNDAASYVPRNDVHAISDQIMLLAHDSQLVLDLTSRGKSALSQYPNIQERLKQELEFLDGFVK
jgi:glycosyltransferase involved in cell wall biosynthesis